MNDNSHCTPCTCSKKLRNVAPYAKIYVLKCQNEQCHSGTTIKWHYDDKLNWLLHLECTNCNDEWSVCSTCINFQVGFKSKRQISMHKNTYHKTINGIIPKRKTKRKHITEKIDEYISSLEKKTKKNINNCDGLNDNDATDNDDNHTIDNDNNNDFSSFDNITDDNNDAVSNNETEHEGKHLYCFIELYLFLILLIINSFFVYNDMLYGFVYDNRM